MRQKKIVTGVSTFWIERLYLLEPDLMSRHTDPYATGRDKRYNDFVRLLTQNERRVYAYILAQVADWNDADDLIQETNVRLWEQFDRFEPGTDFGAWACTIAHFQVMTFRKAQSRSKLVFSDRFVEAIQAEHPLQSSLLDRRRDALRACIDRLDERARQLLRACYEPNTKIRDVAGRIGRTPQATTKALQRVRYALHKCIEKSLASGGAR
jgi:RNA polymerase sigma-70 factor (ECF subfamily)